MRLGKALLVCGLLTAGRVGAQDARFAYPLPSADAYTHARDIRYTAVDTGALRMDVYRPMRPERDARPVVVFHTGGSQRSSDSYTGWARVAAAKGFVAVLADLRMGSTAQDFRTLLSHLVEHGGMYGIDTSAIIVFGASANAFASFPLVEDPAEKRIKAAVMLYSSAPVAQFRRDLPVLYVRAGLDRPNVNAGIDSLVARALAQNAPITVLNHPGGHHGFEVVDNDRITRDVIDQVFAFVERVSTPEHLAAVKDAVGPATAAAFISTGNFAGAVRAYADLVARSPDDARLRLSYGEALLGDRQFAKACAEFATLKGKGLGPRDLGLPAARACLQSGDTDAAIAWLGSIPRQFLPPSVRSEAVFATVRERADFRALFP